MSKKKPTVTLHIGSWIFHCYDSPNGGHPSEIEEQIAVAIENGHIKISFPAHPKEEEQRPYRLGAAISEMMYGLEGQENLNWSVFECVEMYLDSLYPELPPDWLEVLEWRRKVIDPNDIQPLSTVIEHLDEDFGNIDDYTDPTPRMIEALSHFRRSYHLGI